MTHTKIPGVAAMLPINGIDCVVVADTAEMLKRAFPDAQKMLHVDVVTGMEAAQVKEVEGV